MDWQLLAVAVEAVAVVVAVLFFSLESISQKKRNVRNRQWEICTGLLKNLNAYSITEDDDEEFTLHGEICIGLWQLNLDSDEDVSHKIMKVLKKIVPAGYIDVEQGEVKEIMAIVMDSISPSKAEGQDDVLTLFKAYFVPKTPEEHLANVFVSDEPSLETSEKIKAILKLCHERIGEQISKEEILEVWKKHDLGDNFSPVTRYLNELDSRDPSQKQLKKVLQRTENKDKFYIAKEHKEFLERTLKVVKEEDLTTA